MDLRSRIAYGPQWRGIAVMFVLGASVLLALMIGKSFGLGLALGSLPLSFALMGTARRLFHPQFLELDENTLSIPSGFFQTRVTKISYSDIEHAVEVKRGRMTTIQMRTQERAFEINSILLPNTTRYAAVRDFINSRVVPKEKIIRPVEVGKYSLRCSYEGNGEIYDSNGQILWRFKTLHVRPHYPYGFFSLPDFVVYDNADKEFFRIKLVQKWSMGRFQMMENGSPICTLRQRSFLRNKFTLDFTNGKKWVFRMPLFTANFGAFSETGEKIRVRLRTHNIWFVSIDTNVDSSQLVAALAFIHRERLRFN